MKTVDGTIKKISLVFAVILMTVFMSNNIFAEGLSVISVGGNGSTEEINSFGWDETPWLYVQIPEEGMHGLPALWVNEKNEYLHTFLVGSDNAEWFSMDDWNSEKESGTWNVNVASMQYTEGRFTTISNSTSFTVNTPIAPEPISSILFIIGGATLAGRRLIMKKNI